jgi:ubiquinone biosynthesis protein Coq4
MKPTKHLKALYFFFRLARDPNELDRVFQIRDAGSHPVLTETIKRRLRQNPQGRAAIDAKRRMGVIHVADLLAMPEGTLGRAYGEFMSKHGLAPDALPNIDDSQYVQAHLYETHDLWHVVTGFSPDVTGEIGLQAFYAAQLPGVLPAALASALLLNAALTRSSHALKARFAALSQGWMMGQRAKPLFGYDFRANFARPLDRVREELLIDASLATVEALEGDHAPLTPEEDLQILRAA